MEQDVLTRNGESLRERRTESAVSEFNCVARKACDGTRSVPTTFNGIHVGKVFNERHPQKSVLALSAQDVSGHCTLNTLPRTSLKPNSSRFAVWMFPLVLNRSRNSLISQKQLTIIPHFWRTPKLKQCLVASATNTHVEDESSRSAGGETRLL